MGSPCDNDWQSTKMTVLERNCHMFNNPLMSDIMFTCGKSDSKLKYFYAHKYVLATSSTVFHIMFYGHLAEKTSTIHLPDTDEESFEVFLRFLYTDDCTMTTEIAGTVMYLADKYIVPSLNKQCVEVLQKSLRPDNVVTVLEQAVQFDEKELEEKCWQVVMLETEKVVFSEAFSRISLGTLIAILKRKSPYYIKELELFKAVLKWCDTQCAKNRLEATGKNRRAVIGDALYEICFQFMTENDFTQHVACSGLLTADEIKSIYSKFQGFDAFHLKWEQTNSRRVLNYFKRFIHEAAVLSKSYVDDPVDRLCFYVNMPAVFHGVYLFGDDNGSEYEVRLDVDDVKVTGKYTSKRNIEGVYGFHVILPKPISLEKNEVVSMAATIRGPADSYYGTKGKCSVEVDGVIVTFSDSGYEPDNGTGKTQGQFYEIILSTRC